jgi:hypothetical protein
MSDTDPIPINEALAGLSQSLDGDKLRAFLTCTLDEVRAHKAEELARAILKFHHSQAAEHSRMVVLRRNRPSSGICRPDHT